MLLVLFAVTPICCTCRSDEQRDIYHASPCFVPQFAFSPLNMLWIFLQWSRGPFLYCDVSFPRSEFIFSEKMADPSMVTRGGEVQQWLISVAFTINFVIFFVIRSRINVIKLCSLCLWTHVRITSTSFFHHILQNQNSCMEKLQVGHTLLSPFILKQPCNKVWRCSNTEFSCSYNYRQTYITLLAWIW